MKAVKHSLQLQLKSIDGIQVWDSRRQEGSSRLCKLNKISAIVSFTRNRKTKSTGPSLPLQPAGTVETCQRPDQSFRYKLFWDCDLKEEDTILFETNLHRSRKPSQRWPSFDRERALLLGTAGESSTKDDCYESKTFEIIVGLKRSDEFIVFAASALSIDGPVDSVDLSLPLRSFALTGSSANHRYKPQVYFKQDPGRKFALAEDACLNVTVSVHNQISFHQHQLLNISEIVTRPSSSINRGKSVASMPLTLQVTPHERRVQSERLLPVGHEQIVLQPRIRAQSVRVFTDETGTREMEEKRISSTSQTFASAHLMYPGIIVQEQHPHMRLADNDYSFTSFTSPDSKGLAGRSIYEESMIDHHSTSTAPPRSEERSPSHAHIADFHHPRTTLRQEIQRPSMHHDSNMKNMKWKSSKDKSLVRTKNRYGKKVNDRHKKKPKSTLEAFNDFYNALGDVAKEMVSENRDDMSSRSYSYSANSSYSSSFSDGDDDYNDEGSFSDESSRPTIPGHVKTQRESMSVHEDLTVNSYAISLEARRRSTVDSKSGSYDSTSCTDDDYTEY